MRAVAILLLWIVWDTALDSFATDRFYPNTSAVSANGRFRVDAVSPDKGPFQKRFKYTLKDQELKKALWSRSQKEGEGSCISVFADDFGTAVIRTGFDELIVVSPKGVDVGKVGLLREGMTEQERKSYVMQTTAGPMWAKYSHWYFLQVKSERFFVIRPWWGRRIVVDIKLGALASANSAVLKEVLAQEREFAVAELKKGVRGGKNLDREECELVCPVLLAIFLAGQLEIQEAISFLRSLEKSKWSGRSTIGGSWEKWDKEIDPHSYRTLTLRQLAQFSLRRLGEKPAQLPVFEFQRRFKNYKKDVYVEPPALSFARHSKADAVKAGMSAEDVLVLISSPDFVERDRWDYDMDAEMPFSLILRWEGKRVISVAKEFPVAWKKELKREEQLMR